MLQVVVFNRKCAAASNYEEILFTDPFGVAGAHMFGFADAWRIVL